MRSQLQRTELRRRRLRRIVWIVHRERDVQRSRAVLRVRVRHGVQHRRPVHGGCARLLDGKRAVPGRFEFDRGDRVHGRRLRRTRQLRSVRVGIGMQPGESMRSRRDRLLERRARVRNHRSSRRGERVFRWCVRRQRNMRRVRRGERVQHRESVHARHHHMRHRCSGLHLREQRHRRHRMPRGRL